MADQIGSAAAGSIPVVVELDYTKGLAQMQSFIRQIEAMGQGTGLQGMDGLAGTIERTNAELIKTTQRIKTVGAELAGIQEAQEKLGGTRRRQATEEAQTARQIRLDTQAQIRDSAFINRSLEQRQQILAKIATTMKGASISTLDDQQRAVMSRAYSNRALQDYESDRPAASKLALLRDYNLALAEQERRQKAAYDQSWNEAQMINRSMIEQQRIQDNLNRARDRAYTEDERRERRRMGLIQQQAIYENKAYDERQRQTDTVAQAWDRAYAEEARRERGRMAVIQQAAIAENKAYDDRQKAQDTYNKQRDTAYKLQQQYLQRERVSMEAAAAARLDFDNGAITNLQKRHRLLLQIAALEQNSISRGMGSLGSNSAALAVANRRYGIGAVQAYLEGQRGDSTLLDNASTRDAARNSAERARFLQTERERAMRLRMEYRDLHSTARGLAGPLGMLWLTYGNMAPLAAGAGASAGIMAMIRQGSQFVENMTFVKQLSEDTVPDLKTLDGVIASISDNLLTMSERGRYSAVELSASMRVLAQAGYGAQQAMATLPSVVDLSVIGETTPDKAALTIAGTLSAFELGADQAARVASVIAKAAAESQTGVTEMMQSMRQASSVAMDYGASLEETSAVLTLLAKRNIVASAAGTATRNMLVDLAGRTPKARAELERLGVSLYDLGTGRTRATVDVLADLDNRLRDMTDAQRNRSLRAIFDERGLKAASAVFSGDFQKTLDKLRESTENGGFAARQAQALNVTPIAEYEKAINSMTAALIRGFQDSEGSFSGFARTMQQNFQSDAFNQFVRTMAEGVGRLAEFVATMSPLLGLLVKLAIGYGAARVALFSFHTAMVALSAVGRGYVAVQALVNNTLAAYTAVTRMSTVGTTAMSAAMTVAAAEARLLTAALGPIAVLLTAAATAYYLFNDASTKAGPNHVNIEQFKSVSYDQYEAAKKNFSADLDDMYREATGFGDQHAKNMAEVEKALTGITEGEIKSRLRMQQSYAGETEGARMLMLDKEQAWTDRLIDEAKRAYKGKEGEEEAFSRLLGNLAQRQIEIENAKYDLMDSMSKDHVRKQLEDAAEVTGAWAMVLGVIGGLGGAIKGTFDGRGLIGGAVSGYKGTSGEYSQEDRQKALRDRVNATREIVERNNASSKFDLQTYNDLRYTNNAYAGMQGADPSIVEANRKALEAQEVMRRADINARFNDIYADRKVKPDAPVEGDPARGRIARTVISQSGLRVAQRELEIAKNQTKEVQNYLAIRQRLGLVNEESRYQEELRLKLSQENKQQAVEQEQIALDIARAEQTISRIQQERLKNKGPGSPSDAEYQNQIREAQEDIERLTQASALKRQEHETTKRLLDLNYQADSVLRQINKQELNLNTLLKARESITRSITEMYGSSEKALQLVSSRTAALATIQKAQLDVAKEQAELMDQPAETRILALEARRLELARDLLEIRREETRLLFDNAGSAQDYALSLRNAVDDVVKDLRSRRTTLASDFAQGLASGTQGAWKGLFEFARAPGSYEGNPGRNAIATLGNGIFDQIAQGLSDSMSRSMMEGLQGALRSLGIESDTEYARRLAEENLQSVKTMSDSTVNATAALTTTIPQLLQNIYDATIMRNTPEGTVRVNPNPVATVDLTGDAGEVSKVGGAADSATRSLSNMAASGARSLSILGMTASQTYGLMYMGANAFAQGGIKAFAQFAAGAIQQLLMVYAVQKLMGVVGSFFMPSAASVMGASPILSAGTVPTTSFSFADGTSQVDKYGIVRGPGSRRDDNILAWLSPAEGILNADAVNYYGPDFVDKLNKRQIPRYADGYSPVAPVRSSSGRGMPDLHFSFSMDFKQSGAGSEGTPDFDAFGNLIKAEVYRVVQNESRPGGILNRKS